MMMSRPRLRSVVPVTVSTLLTLLGVVGLESTAHAECTPGSDVAFLGGNPASIQLVWNGSGVYSYPFSYRIYASSSASQNCGITMNLSPGLAVGFDSDSEGIYYPPVFPTDYVNRAYSGYEISSAVNYSWPPVGAPLPTWGIGITDSQISAFPSFPAAAILEFDSVEGNFGDPSDDPSCDPSLYCCVATFSKLQASGCYHVMAQIPITVVLAPWIQSMPVLFN